MDCAAPKKINSITEEKEGEDRISRLPDDLIHLVLSFLEHIGFAVQTCLLSTRWKNVWKSLPHLYFDFHCTGKKFFKLVNRTISGRNHTSQVSTIGFNSAWSIPPHLFKRILKYAFPHGIEHLYIRDGGSRHTTCLIPISTFSSQSLKHLTLELQFGYQTGLEITTQSIGNLIPAWNLPNLTYLCLDCVVLKLSSCNSTDNISADLFSKLVNLKDLRLIRCDIEGLDALHVISLSLQHLTISPPRHNYWPPLTCMYVVSTPNLTSFKYIGAYPLKLSATEQLNCLTEATIELLNYPYKMPVEQLLELFSLARNAMLLTISAGAVEILSGAPELLGNRASPFGNLKCLTMGVPNESPAIAKDVITYFLNSSPNASIETMSRSRRRTKLHLNY